MPKSATITKISRSQITCLYLDPAVKGKPPTGRKNLLYKCFTGRGEMRNFYFMIPNFLAHFSFLHCTDLIPVLKGSGPSFCLAKTRVGRL